MCSFIYFCRVCHDLWLGGRCPQLDGCVNGIVKQIGAIVCTIGVLSTRAKSTRPIVPSLYNQGVRIIATLSVVVIGLNVYI